MVEHAISDLITKRAIYDYVVICDESNNTPDRIARNEMYCDIIIEPMRAVEFVFIPIRLRNPGDARK
jgi:phage tail sheath protein FI